MVDLGPLENPAGARKGSQIDQVAPKNFIVQFRGNVFPGPDLLIYFWLPFGLLLVAFRFQFAHLFNGAMD